jgi:hypothetical protein
VFSSGKRVDIGCCLEDYRSRVGTWAGRYSWRGVPRRGEANGKTGDCLDLTVLSSMVLAVLLIIGGLKRILVLLWKWRTPCDSYVPGAAGI